MCKFLNNIKSFGQCIYAMINQRLKRNNLRSTLNTRLLLLLLSLASNAQDEEIVEYMTHFYNSIVLDLCSSCLEKELLSKFEHGEQLYSFQGYITSEYKAFRIMNIRTVYVPGNCDVNERLVTTTIPSIIYCIIYYTLAILTIFTVFIFSLNELRKKKSFRRY